MVVFIEVLRLRVSGLLWLLPRLLTLTCGCLVVFDVPDVDAANFSPVVQEELAKLNIPTPSAPPAYETALRVRSAIKRQDYGTAHQLAARSLAQSHVEPWTFHPFIDVATNITDAGDAAFEDHLSEWVSREPSDAIAVLLRAQYYFEMGWLARGTEMASNTPPDRMSLFQDYMAKALTDIDRAIALDDRNPHNFYLKLRILKGAGLSSGMEAAFDDAIAKHPGYYPLYDAMLSTLAPKWGGSIDKMYAFVDLYAGKTSKKSPLKLLYLSLYGGLLTYASDGCWRPKISKEKRAECVSAVMSHMVRSDLNAKITDALHLYDQLDKNQFSIAVRDILLGLLGIPGGEAQSAAMLQLAADIMNGDTQLKQARPGKNNYAIDQAVAMSWYLKGFYENALTKDRDALADLDAATFSSDEQKLRVMASIYEHMADSYDELHQYIDVIVSLKAVMALVGTTDSEYLICEAYYSLKDYDNALRACTATIEREPRSTRAWYWRGVIYQDAGKAAETLADMLVVAESNDSYRSYAALSVSMVYFNRKDIKGALGYLNKYTYLYDEGETSRANIAAAYNNRCYAYMELGELAKALENCNLSLKYGSLPDAYRKQQELIKRLAPAA